MFDALRTLCGSAVFLINRHSGAQLRDRNAVAPDASGKASLTAGGAQWTMTLGATPCSGSTDTWAVEATFKLQSGAAPETSVGLALSFARWSTSRYVFQPGAVYAGNRFESLPLKYSPRYPLEKSGPRAQTLMADVPRLNLHEGPSRIQMLSGDMATPAFGFHCPAEQKGFLVLAEHRANGAGELGWDIEESQDRTQLHCRICAPGVREQRYTHMCTTAPSTDRGADFAAGASVTLRFVVTAFEAPELKDFYGRFFSLRKALEAAPSLPNILSLSAATEIIRQKYDREAWRENLGLYATNVAEKAMYRFSTGWAGGALGTLALAQTTNPTSRARSIKTVDTLLTRGVSPCGFFYTKCDDTGTWMGDDGKSTKDTYANNWSLMRRQGDALFYVLKQVSLFELQEPGWQAPAPWHSALQGCADAFVRLWDRYGQLGHFFDQTSGDITVGNSCSGAVAPAGLVLAWQRYRKPDYLRVAEAAAEGYYQRFTRLGYTTGGPGDAVQVPDSESAAGLLESYIGLHEATGSPAWLERAEEAGMQLASWIMNYDYHFPAASEFGKLDMRSTGTVFANAQNKHSAPGLCTHSGVGFLKLYRATGNPAYLDVMRDLAHSLPQFVSRDDRPIHDGGGRPMPSGWINERVNTSDWDNNLGGVFYGSCWCEVSLLLTWAEVPGLYVEPETGFVCALDHVDVERLQPLRDGVTLRVSNPTRFPAQVRVLAETASQRTRALGENRVAFCPVLDLAPGQSRDLCVRAINGAAVVELL